MKFETIFGKASYPAYQVMVGLLLLTSLVWGEGKGFAGYWKSTFGHISIDLNGRTATGVYSDGKVKGVINGRLSDDGQLLVGNWSEGPQQGKFIFKLQKEGNSFIGKWSKSVRILSGDWIGVRVEEDVPAVAIQPEDLAGEWETNFGTMTLRVEEEGGIRGTFVGEINEGRIAGWIDAERQRFVVNWSDQKQQGRAEFRLLSGKSALIGDWWFGQKRYGGTWYGVRGDTPQGCISGDCENGSGTYVWAEGPRYEGEWRNGAPHGIGKLYRDNGGLESSGLWLDGVFQGRIVHLQTGTADSLPGTHVAKIVFPDKTMYEGTLSNYEITGQGSLKFPGGDEYRGEVRRGRPDGNGWYRFADTGDEYSGRFRKGVPQGRGVYIFADGTRYEGQFRNGMRHGKGVLYFADGRQYQGRWNKDVPDDEHGFQPVAEAAASAADKLRSGEPPGQLGAVATGATGLSQIAPVAWNRPSKRQAFLLYQVREQVVPVENALEALSKRKEVYFSWRLVFAAPALEMEAVQRYLQNTAGMDGDFVIEPMEDLRDHLKKVINHYRYDVYPTKILVTGEPGMEITEEKLAAVQ